MKWFEFENKVREVLMTSPHFAKKYTREFRNVYERQMNGLKQAISDVDAFFTTDGHVVFVVTIGGRKQRFELGTTKRKRKSKYQF